MSLEVLVTLGGTILAGAGVGIAYLQLRRTPGTIRQIVGPEPEDKSPRERREVKHNLPPRQEFVGRRSEINRALRGFESRYPIVSIEGLGGIGKTALAREVAWLCATGNTESSNTSAARFEAIVWAEDVTGNLDINRLLDLAAEVLGFPYILQLPIEQKRRAVYRCAQRAPTLFVVDNLETVADRGIWDFLVNLPEPPSRAVVTTREKQLRDSWSVSVGPLSADEGLALMAKEGERLGVTSLLGSAQSSRSALYDAAGGNPLAIRFAAGQVKLGVPVEEVVQDLIEAQDDGLFTAVFDRDWRELLKGDEPCRRVLMTMSLLPAAASRDALRAGARVHGRLLRTAIGRLIDLSLVDVSGNEHADDPKFQLHSLTRAFARRELSTVPDVEGDIEERLIDYYLVFATRYSNTYADVANLNRMEAEQATVLSFAARSWELAQHSGSTRNWRRVLRFADAMSPYLWGRGRWNDQLEVSQRAIEAAQHLADSAAIARHYAQMGRVYLWLGNFEKAIDYLAASESALPVDTRNEDLAFPKRLRAQIASAEGRYEEAEDLLTDILDVSPITVDDNGRAATLLELGQVAEGRNRPQVAWQRYEEALRLDQQLETIEGEAVTLSHLGEVALATEDYAAARQFFERGLTLAKRVQRIGAIGRCELGLAKIEIAQGNYDVACTLGRQAEQTYDRLGLDQKIRDAKAIVRAALKAS
ncbi:tetratricopeptide repeat protein [Paractinoplanes toevensis]|uniref:tetratricopeptide repeat protein n=1 Tax=Paractinoplanes toevensis TaxID=571911 RepID=UPI001BB35279|nr:tetratricopeptide repeat protein [Actinoplanes toevensis]